MSGGLSTYKKTQKEEEKKIHMCYILIIIIIIILIFFQCVLSVKVFGVNLFCEMDWEQMGCGG
jgi:t-SNARE complex subunit (syntaxin)